MKKIALLLLLAASFSMPAFAADGAEPIKLISYNLRNSHGKDGDNVWMKRRRINLLSVLVNSDNRKSHYFLSDCQSSGFRGVQRDKLQLISVNICHRVYMRHKRRARYAAVSVKIYQNITVCL